MRTREVARALAIATGVVMLGATTAAAQNTFNYFTTGFFTSPFGTCNQAPLGTTTSPPGAATATCTGGGFALTYTGQATAGIPYLNGSQIELGQFALSGMGAVDVTDASGVFFTLLVNQVSPTTGVAAFQGSITGSVNVSPTGAFSSLIWTPNREVASIGNVTYDLIFDQGTAGIRIPAQGNATIKAVGTVVPEPSTYVLLATGIGALGLVARRRRAGAI